MAVIFFRRYLSAELMLLRSMGVIDIGPETALSSAEGWLALLQDARLLGLLLLDLVDVINYALVGLIFLALFGALRRAATSSMVIAAASGFVGVAVYFASNQAFSMLALSNRYAAATTDAQRSLFLAAGEALLAIHHQGAGIHLSLMLVQVAGLIISLVMLRSEPFSKATAVAGILANALGLGYFVALAIAPALSFLPPSLSAPFRLIWYILIARRLFQLAADSSRAGTQPGRPASPTAP